MADVFRGAGGASAGGQYVGFLLIRPVDSNEEACPTCSLNFPGVVCLHGDVHQYRLQKGDVLIDVLHASYVNSSVLRTVTRVRNKAGQTTKQIEQHRSQPTKFYSKTDVE